MKALSALSPEVRQYLLVTGNYWAFTLTDGEEIGRAHV